jgi:hypothetical protein
MNRVQILQTAARLVRYAGQIEKHLQRLDEREQTQALADLAEAGGICRRLYSAVSESLKNGSANR